MNRYDFIVGKIIPRKSFPEKGEVWIENKGGSHYKIKSLMTCGFYDDEDQIDFNISNEPGVEIECVKWVKRKILNKDELELVKIFGKEQSNEGERYRFTNKIFLENFTRKDDMTSKKPSFKFKKHHTG